jgi:hypothetical protein
MIATPLGSPSGHRSKKMKDKQSKKYMCQCRKYPNRNRHHLFPKNRGGDDTPDNLLLLKINRHYFWHKLFGKRSFEEVILLLVRIHRAKGRCLYAKMGRACRLAPCFDIQVSHQREIAKQNGARKNGKAHLVFNRPKKPKKNESLNS